MAKLSLTNSDEEIIVDYDMVNELSKTRWHLSHNGSVVGNRVFLARVIMGSPDGLVVDHINRDKLDNRKSNLRICTLTQNTYNQEKHAEGSSIFKGVHFDKGTRKWRARISPNRKSVHLGLFKTEEEAAKAYDNAAKEFFGEYACLNGGVS